MGQKTLTDALIRRLPRPKRGNRVTYDALVPGFGARVTAAGARSFVLNYRTQAGRERRYTIGGFPNWRTSTARQEARGLKARIDRGEDPLGTIEAGRVAPTVSDLCDRFNSEHLPRTRTSTQLEYRAILSKYVRPVLGSRKVAEITFSDVDTLHRRITGHAPYRANRTVAVLSKMFSLAMRWQWRTDNPAKGIERNQEQKRQRYLFAAELVRLTDILVAHEDRDAANAIRLLLLTGARRGEALAMRWADLDLVVGVWTKPGATTKQKTTHRVPLSAPAVELLRDLRTAAPRDAVYVFPGIGAAGHRRELQKDWVTICTAARIDGVRLHDLRHTYASLLAAAGLSLPIIGALLGHTQPSTTHRYAHLLDDPLRAATEHVGAVVTGKPVTI